MSTTVDPLAAYRILSAEIATVLTDLPTRLERTVVPIVTGWPDHVTTSEVPGYISDEFPGLAVTGIVAHDTGDLVWTLTHIESGRSLPMDGRRLETNLLVAVKAGQLCDWAQVHHGDDLAGLKDIGSELRRYSELVSGFLEYDPDDDLYDEDGES